jgi:3-dehydroquinate synthase
VGAFWQPSMVIIDPLVLETLPKRHYNNGLIEAVKEGLIQEPELFELFENEEIEDSILEILERALQIKRKIVEEDESESGIRKLLNFGHTFGHAFESYYDMEDYLHGECVGLGMLKVIKNTDIKNRLKKVLERLDAPTSCEGDPQTIFQLMKNDKKANQTYVDIIQVDTIGEGKIEQWTWDDIRKELGL